MSENEQGIKVTCEFCNEYEGTKKEVIGHQITCKKKQALKDENNKDQPPSGSPPREEPPTANRTRDLPDRKKRKPFGAPELSLSAPAREGFTRRWFNDNWFAKPGRILRAKEAGYERAEGYEPRVVGPNKTGTAIKAVLMEIPTEWYDEDQAVKQKKNDRIEEMVEQGTIEEKAGDGRYLPEMGIKVTHGESETDKGF